MLLIQWVIYYIMLISFFYFICTHRCSIIHQNVIYMSWHIYPPFIFSNLETYQYLYIAQLYLHVIISLRCNFPMTKIKITRTMGDLLAEEDKRKIPTFISGETTWSPLRSTFKVESILNIIHPTLSNKIIWNMYLNAWMRKLTAAWLRLQLALAKPFVC